MERKFYMCDHEMIFPEAQQCSYKGIFVSQKEVSWLSVTTEGVPMRLSGFVVSLPNMVLKASSYSSKVEVRKLIIKYPVV